MGGQVLGPSRDQISSWDRVGPGLLTVTVTVSVTGLDLLALRGTSCAYGWMVGVGRD
jgi:hypothetical protein